MARPTKFEKGASDRIIKALKTGATRKASSYKGGVSYRTFLNWLERGEKEESPELIQFFHSVELAENEAALRFEGFIIKAAKADPKYALEWLKRRRRDEWGDNVRLDVDDEITGLMAALAAGSKAQAS